MQAWHLFWRTSAKDCFCTAHTHHSLLLIRFALYSAPSSSSSLLLLRGSRPEVFYKKGVLRNFAKFTGKHLCQGLFFNEVAGLGPASLLKRDAGTGVFLWIFQNFLGHLFFIKHLYWLLLASANISDVCFWFKFTASKNLNLVPHFHWSHFHRCYFLFSCFFLFYSVLFHFFLSLLIKRILLSWEFIKMFLPTLTSSKYVHPSK